MCADKDRGVFYRLAPHLSVARVLRRDCGSGGNFGVVVERPALLNSLALCLVVDGGWRRADVGIRPYADMMVARHRADTQVRPYKRYPVGADALVGPR